MAHTAVARFLMKFMLAPIVVVWAFHLAQRKYPWVGEGKRMATMLISVLILALWAVFYCFITFQIDDVFLIPAFLAAAAVAGWKRKAFFPYRLGCVSCRAPLPIKKILFFDSNACDACDPPKPKEGDVQS